MSVITPQTTPDHGIAPQEPQIIRNEDVHLALAHSLYFFSLSISISLSLCLRRALLQPLHGHSQLASHEEFSEARGRSKVLAKFLASFSRCAEWCHFVLLQFTHDVSTLVALNRRFRIENWAIQHRVIQIVRFQGRSDVALNIDNLRFCFLLCKFWRFPACEPRNRAIRNSRFCAAKVCTESKPQGFPKADYCEGGEISIIGVARAPVAIMNLASNPCENI